MKYFRKGDILIYMIVCVIFIFMGMTILKFDKNSKPDKIEIYVNNKLEYIYKLKNKQKIFKVPTPIGGVTVEIKDMKVRVLTSYSPKKLCVKQGWISKSGETIIGVPDKLIIKIKGKQETELDYVLQ
ncbi:NusG domain II-containing protein [Haliovirga abyssi]|uniref:NusG domain-containing protein n=1 Tax=Haliovirga abyssi TaxID=2996794 RepID=A0AAU9D6J4_9FUSO|nr:NusG domain II-containing protein [Haliovirga abyssi]BDU51641.1 hypothetical protein HLVA_22100 [Haliovirga abyssi]